jgi:hypothetical protein
MDYITRNEWGARPPTNPYTQVYGSEGIIVHHLGDNVERDPKNTDYAALMRQTQNYHMDHHGWSDFAYGFAVGGGKIYMGRGFGVIDAADIGPGYLMHSVVWLGDSNVNQCPDEDMALIWSIFDEHNSMYGKKVEGGHRDINQTACPGDDIYAKLQLGREHYNVPINLKRKVRGSDMYTIINGAGAKECFVLRSNGEVWNQWQELPGVTFSKWNKTLDGDCWESLAEPLRVHGSTWLNVAGDFGYGFANMTAIQAGPGKPWTIHITDELAKFLASVK